MKQETPIQLESTPTKRLYTVRRPTTTITVNQSVEGETIERRVERLMNNNEPIGDESPIIYTDRKDGVIPEYNIRSDRFDLSIDAMDKVTADKLAKRAEFHKPKEPNKNTNTNEPPAQTGASGGSEPAK